ncbi:MAG: hypothetical protein WC100_05760 [Sterolibacterium sp.]
MKTAIYIEDGDVQLVLTPENEWEQKTLNSFGEDVTASIKHGQFYTCQGGWHRHPYGTAENERSLILRARNKVDAG